MLATVHLTLNNHVVNMWCPCYMILFCSKTFYSFLSSPMINVVTISLDVTDVTDHFNPNPRVLKIERCEIIKKKWKWKRKIKMKKKLSLYSLILTVTNYVTILICLYLYQYLSLWDTLYIITNRLMSTFQHKFNHANPFSHS